MQHAPRFSSGFRASYASQEAFFDGKWIGEISLRHEKECHETWRDRERAAVQAEGKAPADDWIGLWIGLGAFARTKSRDPKKKRLSDEIFASTKSLQQLFLPYPPRSNRGERHANENTKQPKMRTARCAGQT